jgi:hypothetical protein
VFELLDSCADRCGMSFSADGRDLIEDVACGSPYHARLFGMHAALAALRRGDSEVSPGDVLDGFAECFEEWAALNGEDAATFRAISSGARGDSTRFVELAWRIARSSEQASSGERLTPDSEEVKAAFGSAIDPSADPVAFRDATAPQFLLALHHLAGQGPRGQKGTIRA